MSAAKHLEDLARILRGVGVVASKAAADSAVIKRLTASDYSVVLRAAAAAQQRAGEAAGGAAQPAAASAAAVQQQPQQRNEVLAAAPVAPPPAAPQQAQQQLNRFVQSRLHVPPLAETPAPEPPAPGAFAAAREPPPPPPQQQQQQVQVHPPEPEVHGLQGVTFIEPDAPPASLGVAAAAAAAAPAQQQPAAAAPSPPPPPRKFKPRERSVPSSALGRVAGFAGLGASLLYGTVRESVSRAFRGPGGGGSGAGGEPHPTSSFLTEQNAERLANALCRMRGAALKIGQMLSIQDENVLPPQFQAALERVRAGADVMPRKQLEQVLREELGLDWRSKMADFDYTPMAAASIGQVHGVVTHDGRRCAMKIQYPGVARSIESDVDNLMRLINVANILPKGLYVENAVKAGQVWFPDSALKTAQAMEEFGLEGLPLFVLANWRGFSGGQRDLFEGVLQAGSLIVDSLRTYRQPVMVYLPPGCELRGGAWVVIDSQINADMVEMYADDSAQGGVLEPQGVVEIKYRTPDLVATMHRIDPVILKLKVEGGPGSEAAIKARERQLLPVYHQVAVQFAQMHDGPVRMLAKGVLRGIVPWRRARAFFVSRLKRRLTEEALLKHIAAADGSVGRREGVALLKSWYLTSVTGVKSPTAKGGGAAAGAGLLHSMGSGGSGGVTLGSSGNGSSSGGAGGAGVDGGAAVAAADEKLWRDDGAFLSWVEGASGAARIAMELKALRTGAAARAVQELSSTVEGTEGLVRGLQAALKDNPSLLLQLRSLVKTG